MVFPNIKEGGHQVQETELSFSNHTSITDHGPMCPRPITSRQHCVPQVLLLQQWTIVFKANRDSLYRLLLDLYFIEYFWHVAIPLNIFFLNQKDTTQPNPLQKKLLVEPSRLGNTYKRKYKADIYFPPQLLSDLPSSSSNLFLLKIVAPTVSCISDNPFSITTSVCIVFIVFLQPRKALICDGCVMWIELESNNQHVPVNCHNRACYFIYPQLTAFSRVRKKCHNIVNWRWMLQLQKLKAVVESLDWYWTMQRSGPPNVHQRSNTLLH